MNLAKLITCIAAVICLTGATLPSTAQGGSSTVTLPSDGSKVAIITTHKGDYVQIQLSYNPSDPSYAPNDRSEYPVIVSSTGDQIAFPPDAGNYYAAYYATSDGIELDGFITAADGDETATVTATISSPPPKDPCPGNPPGERGHPKLRPLCSKIPGNPTRVSGGNDDLVEDLESGNVSSNWYDPVATRGYPLTCNIHLNTQGIEAGRAMGNATFTYDIHITTGNVYDKLGNAVLHWMLVDGDGTQLDFGPASGPPTPTSGIFCQLVQSAGGGYQVTNAGPPESLAVAGNYSYTFNSLGQLLQIVDPKFNKQTLSYDSNGHLLQVADLRTGRQITFNYSGALISQVVENGGQAITSLSYVVPIGRTDGLLLGISVGNAISGTACSIQYGYNLEGLAWITHDNDDWDNRITFSYVWWPSSIPGLITNLAQITLPENDAGVQVTWGMGLGDVQQADVNGAHFYTFTGNEDLQSVLITGSASNPGVFASDIFGYDPNHLLTSTSDGKTSSTLTYFANGLLQNYSDSGGRFSQFSYNGVDPKSIADGLGTLAQFDYADALQPHVPTTLTDGSQAVWTWGHNAYGQTKGLVTPPGSPYKGYTIKYDENPASSSLGYAKSFIVGAGDTTTFDSYDGLGDLLQLSTYPQGTANATQYSYDAAQRMTQVQHADGTTYQWSYNGRFLDHTTDESGTQYYYSYCPGCGALEAIYGPLNWANAWNVDSDHDVTSFTDARQNTTTYKYAAPHRIQSITYPDQSNIAYSYDSSGRVSVITNARGQVAQIQYDRSGRPSLRIVTDRLNKPLIDVDLVYNTDDTLQQMTDQTGVAVYGYTPNRLLKTVTYYYSSSGLYAQQRLDYTYNPDNSRSSLTWSSGKQVVGQWKYKYDKSGRLQSVTANGETTSYTYDGEGKLKTQQNANGTRCAYTYNDARGWPISITYNRGAFPFASYALAYDTSANSVGNLTAVGELDGSSVQYGYDALYRLTNESRSGSNPISYTYDYDLAGNLTSLNGATFAGYDAANKISSLSGGSVAYDADGNLTFAAGTTWPSGRFGWDDKNELVSQQHGESITNYGYDGFGHRVWSQNSFNARTFYIFDGDHLLGEVSAGKPSVAYTWGANGLVSERLLSQHRSIWYDFGPQGETRHLTDSTGAIVDSYTYTAYGAPVSATNNNPNPFRYGGQYGYYSDGPSGLMLCGARWYDPYLTRWLSRDPIGYKGGSNLYAYVRSNPVRSSDPSGLQDADTPVLVTPTPSPYDELENFGKEILNDNGKPKSQEFFENLHHLAKKHSNDQLEGVPCPSSLMDAYDAGKYVGGLKELGDEAKGLADSIPPVDPADRDAFIRDFVDPTPTPPPTPTP